jgi:hypothetical protein
MFFAAPSFASAEVLNDPYATYMERTKDIFSGKYAGDIYIVVEDDDDLVMEMEATMKGSAMRQAGTEETYDIAGTLAGTVQYEDTAIEYKIDVIRKGDYFYLKFKNSDVKMLRKVWVRVHADDLDSFAEEVAAAEILGFADVLSSTAEEQAHDEAITALEKKHHLYIVDEGPVTEKIGGKKVDTYYLKLNRSTVVAYYRELDMLLDEAAEEGTNLSFDGFREGLSDEDYVDDFVDTAYYQVSFDRRTGMPVQFGATEQVYDGDLRTGVIAVATNDKINKKVSVKAPKKWTDAADVLDRLND